MAVLIAGAPGGVFRLLRFGVVTGTDASGAHAHTLGLAVHENANRLDIGDEGTFDVLNDVQTDTAGHFGKTFAGDASARDFLFTAHHTYVAHLVYLKSYYVLF